MNEKYRTDTVLNVLSLEDSHHDFEIIREMLIDAGFDLRIARVETEKEFTSALTNQKYDIILADFKLPGFDAFTALRLSIDICPNIPFICVSGAIGEETAIELIRQGALDYVLKDRPERLPFAVERALDEAKEKEARRRAEGALRESEVKFRTIFDGASDGILIADAITKKFIQGNTAICSMLGYTKEEIENLTIYDIHPPKDISHVLDEFEKQAKEEKFLAEGLPVLRKDGSIFFADISSAPISVGGIHYLVGIFRDITERMKAEAEIKKLAEDLQRRVVELRETQDYLENLITYANAPIIVWNPDFKITRFNQAFEKLTGRKASEVIGKELSLLFPYDSREASLRHIRETIDGERWEVVEIPIGHQDGRVHTVLWNSANIYDRDGEKVVATIAQGQDITERKMAEEVLRENEAKLQAIFHTVGTGILIIDKDTQIIIEANKTAIEMTGLPKERIIGQICHSLVCPAEVGKCPVKDLGQTVDHSERKLIHADGQLKDILKTVHTITIKGRDYYVESFIDISDRKKAEEDLKESLESLRKAFGTTIQVMVSAVETRDPYTAGHQLRSADLARAIATEMGFTQDRIEGIRMAGSIHDLGKLSIPAEILSKPTELTNIEFSLIKEHARKGYEILKDIESSWPLAEMVYQHHERMDGSGYPRNLKGDDILMEARIMSVADVVEAMASHRPYRPGLGIDAALEEIEKNRGTFYDNAVADACLRLFREKGYQLLQA